MFSFLALIAPFGIYKEVNNTSIKKDDVKNKNNIKIKWYSQTILPFLAYAAVLSLCQASLIQSIGFYITDLFREFDDLPTLISMTFALLSISTIVSQYLFTDTFPMKNFNLLLFGTLLLVFSYSTMAFFFNPSLFIIFQLLSLDLVLE